LIAKRTPITLFFTARGCPFKCSFCSKPSFWDRWRFSSPQRVVDEMEECLGLGINDIMIYDDIFTSNRKRVFDICHEIRTRRLDVAWNIRTRVDMVDKELLSVMQRSGCYRISYGVESGDPCMLARYNKGISISTIKQTFDMTRDAGIEILAYYMVGGPGETYQSIRNTFSAMHHLNADYVHITHVVPYPKTKLFDMAVERKVADPGIWKYLKTLHYDTFPMFTDGELSRQDIFKQVKQGYREYYFRPRYIWHRLMQLNNFQSIWRHIQAAFSLLRK
jgi:anaerobic magnesium-protoporphyrin IX monomethyl ester cyclase